MEAKRVEVTTTNGDIMHGFALAHGLANSLFIVHKSELGKGLNWWVTGKNPSLELKLLREISAFLSIKTADLIHYRLWVVMSKLSEIEGFSSPVVRDVRVMPNRRTKGIIRKK